ncbi:MAG: GAF domain-containing protein [Spirulina sp. SIO3F2]|nr:GAF domain-containing protein [Spirulina sp. SIO3F2]
MSDRALSDLSAAELIQKVESLQARLVHLEKVKLAFDAQDELVRSLVSMGRAATGRLMLRSMLMQTIKVSVKLTNAEESSLFLLDNKGAVTESILARGATIREQRADLIGKVLDSGLAGWVVRNRQPGIITDTRIDDRWVTLPNQPYTVGSALCIPILRGKALLGLLTLTHPETHHFTEATSELLQMCATQMALALDNARLYVLEHQKQEEKNTEDAKIPETKQDLSQVGIFIIADNGKFLYANPLIAQIFGYEFGELVVLDSILKLVATTHYHQVAEQLQQCFQGYNPVISAQFQGQRKDRRLVDIALYGTRTKFYGKYVIIGVLSLQ